MSRVLLVEPLVLPGLNASRGTGTANLVSADPREVWADVTTGSPATFAIDLGSVRSIDTIFLGYLGGTTAATSWTITAGPTGLSETLQPAAALRVPDVAGRFASVGHALWRGAARDVRYLSIAVTQPTGAPLTAGVLIVGRAFDPAKGQEWGAGRRPIDTGSTSWLPTGGASVIEGARKRGFGWTWGDLSVDEADQLDAIAEARGSTLPMLVIEDDARTAGLRSRIHYGLIDRWKAYERRNRSQTRWEMGIEEWV